MNIGTFFVLLGFVVVLSYGGFAIVGWRQQAEHSGMLSERTAAAALITVMLGVALAARSLDFGVDTITYFALYREFCDVAAADFDPSYRATFALLNLLSLGACSSDFLVPVWTLFIVLSFALLPISWSSRIRLAALGLFSLVGIELATNALRQGFSAVVLMLGVAWFGRNKLVGVILFVMAALLHSSAILVLVAFGLSQLRWRWFGVGLISIALAAINYEALTIIPPVEKLVYEITKYAAHEADDFWIRVIAAVQLTVTVAAAFMLRRQFDDPQQEKSARFSLDAALKIAITCLPYLPMPYFGYRYIYGIYLIVLFLCRRQLLDDRSIAFEVLLVCNVVLVLAWSFGSSFISETSFIAL